MNSIFKYSVKTKYMNSILKYNIKTKYAAKDLKGGYTGKEVSLLDVYFSENMPSDNIQLLNIFKDHHIVAWTGPTTIGPITQPSFP